MNKEVHEDREEEKSFAILPPNGGWGWLVVACAFYCNVVLDGIQLTFGIFLGAISETFKAEHSQVALAGSLIFGVHLLTGPLCAGFNKVFGIRPVVITGSFIACVGVAITYFATGYWYLYFSYGIVGGIGLGLVYMNTLLITTMYFTTLLPIAVGIVVAGTGFGTMIFAAAGEFLLSITNWRNSFLMQACLAGSMGIAAITFRPLKPKKVRIYKMKSRGSRSKSRMAIHKAEEPRKRKGSIFIAREQTQSSTSVSTIQNIIWENYLGPTIQTAPIDDSDYEESSRLKCSKCCRKSRRESEESEELILSEIKTEGRRKSYMPVVGCDFEEETSSLVKGKFKLADHRIDVKLNFPVDVTKNDLQQGSATHDPWVSKRPPKKDCRLLVYSSPPTGILPSDSKGSAEEGQPEQSKPQTVYTKIEFESHHSPKAWELIKESLKTMIDFHLLKSIQFTLFVITGALQISALLVVFIFEKERNLSFGYSEQLASSYIIVLGAANTFWRVVVGAIAILPKTNHRVFAVCGSIIGGIFCIASGYSKDPYFHATYCIVFGLAMACFAVFRIVMLVELIEPKLVNNASGISFMFMGISSIITPPLFGWIKEMTDDFNIIFILTGSAQILSGFLLVLVKKR